MDDTRDMRRRIITTAVKRALVKNRPELNDAELAGAMIDVIISTQDNAPASLPLMFTILIELVRRVITQLPAPTRCDDNGRPLYNLTEVAHALGLPDVDIDQMRDYLRDKGVQSVDSAQTHTLN